MERPTRPIRAELTGQETIQTRDGVELLLKQYRGGDKGPVVLSAGLGVSSLIFSIDTIPENLLEHLYERGWDVWLLDYRAAIGRPAASTQWSADDVAREDYPAAIDRVREATGEESVQVVAHCFGATTFCMAMLAGLEGVRSAVCSQVATDFVTPLATRLKCRLLVPDLLRAVGVPTMTAAVEERRALTTRLYELLLRWLPTAPGERCTSPVCHRISFMYGSLYRHFQLDPATHVALGEMFGVANLTAFVHLARMVRQGHVVDLEGKEAYLPHLERMAIPMTFVHGARNACYLPRSTELSMARLAAANGEDLYRRHVIPDYGHIDCIFGQHAHRDVYPAISQHLEETAR